MYSNFDWSCRRYKMLNASIKISSATGFCVRGLRDANHRIINFHFFLGQLISLCRKCWQKLILFLSSLLFGVFVFSVERRTERKTKSEETMQCCRACRCHWWSWNSVQLPMPKHRHNDRKCERETVQNTHTHVSKWSEAMESNKHRQQVYLFILFLFFLLDGRHRRCRCFVRSANV